MGFRSKEFSCEKWSEKNRGMGRRGKGRKCLQTNPWILKTAHLASHAWVCALRFHAVIGHYKLTNKGRYAFYWWGWVGVFKKFFGKKSWPSHFRDECMTLHKYLNRSIWPSPPTSSKTNITGNVAHITASAYKAVNCVACDCIVKTWKWARMCKE